MADDDLSSWPQLLKRVAAGEACSGLAKGVKVSKAMVEELINVAPRERNHQVLQDTNFSGVIFEDDVSFAGVVFRAGANFSAATFEGKSYFGAAHFCGFANFRQVSFGGQAIFEGLQASETERLSFSGARFAKYSSFGPLHQRQVDFNQCQFADVLGPASRTQF